MGTGPRHGETPGVASTSSGTLRDSLPHLCSSREQREPGAQMSLRRIEGVEELHRYLQFALQLEHSTIPPYLTALYSIHPGTNEDAVKAIQSVVVEEMLHIALVSNILNAVGGDPDFTDEGFIANYPAHLPDGETDFEVSLRPFSPEAIK